MCRKYIRLDQETAGGYTEVNSLSPAQARKVSLHELSWSTVLTLLILWGGAQRGSRSWVGQLPQSQRDARARTPQGALRVARDYRMVNAIEVRTPMPELIFVSCG